MIRVLRLRIIFKKYLRRFRRSNFINALIRSSSTQVKLFSKIFHNIELTSLNSTLGERQNSEIFREYETI